MTSIGRLDVDAKSRSHAVDELTSKNDHIERRLDCIGCGAGAQDSLGSLKIDTQAADCEGLRGAL